MKKQGIIFDMDGTLWDSAANVAESWNEAIRQDGRLNKALTETDIKGVMGKTMDVIAKLLFPEISEKEQETLLAECCRIENDYLREHGGVLYPDEMRAEGLAYLMGWQDGVEFPLLEE